MRFESALEVVGALKRRFGEPLTVTDICRQTPLSYQPVYEYVRRLVRAEAVSLSKVGPRLLCEPANTAAGALWLAQWSALELRSTEVAPLRELAGLVQGRIGEHALPPTAIVAVDPQDRRRPELRCTAPGLASLALRATVRVVSADALAEWLRGREGSWEVARRIIPLVGHQQLWSLALCARDEAAGSAGQRAPARRRSIFGD